MVTEIRVSTTSDMPIYRQIVAQVRLMVETGSLRDGDRLPSTRLLADNLHVNRNTVAHAYRELRDAGLVESRRRLGMVVVGSRAATSTSQARARARSIVEASVRDCLELGLEAEEIQVLVAHVTAGAERRRLSIVVVECNADRADAFAEELTQHLGTRVRPLVLDRHEPRAEAAPDLVLTTFFHLAEVRAAMRTAQTEVIGLVAAPHIQTLVQLAQVPKGRTIGLLYSTEHQASAIRDSLTQSGIENTRVLHGTEDSDIAGVDLVVVPSELPELAERLRGRVRVVEFGNVLDAASLTLVSEVVRDMQRAKADATP